ncbi:MAG TPA: MFS transporter [Allosphingosinicella sp.]|jgi:MFS family permease|nr:MFS transporter [Allosphingosinicella sp.]
MAGARPSLPRTVWALGLVSLAMDMSSEIIHALLPLFMTATLGLSVAAVGLIEGIAEATANVTKLFSGYLSDRIGRRKPLILLGYGLAAASKPLFPIASGALPILAARFADRIGKGIRGAPRDALIADVTEPAVRGRAFGLRQSLDTAGAVIGPLLALGLMALLAGNVRLVFWLAVIPAVIAVLLVLVGVEDRAAGAEAKRVPLRLAELKALGGGFWSVILIGAAFSLARFSEAFLILKAHDEGLSIALAPLVLVVMNLAYSAGAYPAGALSDRWRPRTLLLCGIVVLVLADLILALDSGIAAAFAGIALWGAHLALTQGILSRMVADAAAPRLRGSAFGIFNLASGLALLLASLVAGLLWDRFGAEVTFIAAAAFAALAALLLVLLPLERQTAG